MTLYGATSPIAGGIMSPFQGTSAGVPAGSSLLALPAGMPMLEAMSRGLLPRNADVSAINGVSTGAQNPTPVDDLMSNGAGNQVNAGVAVPNSSGNPAGNGAINQQVFVAGVFSANAGLSTGPAPTNTETLTSCPVSGATLGGNITLVAGGFQG